MMKKLLFVCLCCLSTINAVAQSFVFPMGAIFPFFDLNIDVKSKIVSFRIDSGFNMYPYNKIINKETFYKSYIITELEHGVLNENVYIRMNLKETKSGKRLGTVLFLGEREGRTYVWWKVTDKENHQDSDIVTFLTPDVGHEGEAPSSVQEFNKLLKYVKTHPKGNSSSNKSTSSQSKTTSSQTQPKTTTSRAYTSCPDNNHPHIIDLGLPSGTKWACCNVDAKKPEDYGGYYAWGETSTKTEYSSSNYRYEGVNIGSDISGTQYDVAHVKWGGKWQMPTVDKVKELVENCKYEWTTLNGVKGYVFTGHNGKSIFIPAAGVRYYGSMSHAGLGEQGHYWLSTQYSSDLERAFNLFFRSDDVNRYEDNDRSAGQSVRPVIWNDNENKQIKKQSTSSQSKTTPSQTQPKTTTSRAYTSCPDNNHPHIIDLGLPSGTKWACCNVDANKPEDYGGYYAWGETSTKTEFSSSNYRYDQVNLGNDISGTQYDVAHVKWGGKWQMPTQEQIKELDDNCKYEWTTMSGVKGGKFTGPNGGSIFLPAAGYPNLLVGENGFYWSSTQSPSYSICAYHLYFYSGDADWGDDGTRRSDRSVRPVARN